ncbi:MAG TPA: VCBS repeat-containing protein [Kofleriaceae bacterium]|nr:VCBS repeat-containing protein [Kofleriaceae bacterium]
MIRISLALLCAACSGTMKHPTTEVADAVVGKHVLVIGVPGGDPKVEHWSGKGEVVLAGDLTGDGLADAVVLGDAVQLIVGRPPHAFGSAVADKAGTVFLDAVMIGDLDNDGANEIVVDGGLSYPPPGSVIGATPHTETFMTVIRGGKRGLDHVLERIAWPATRRALLPSFDIDGDRKADLVTYQCEARCTVSSRRALDGKLGPETVIATWPAAQRVVTGAVRATGYVLVAVEPHAIRSYALERGSLREVASLPPVVRADADLLLGPIAVGDYDRDGRLDLAVVTGNNQLLVWSDTRPERPLALASPERVRTVAFVDLDRDGDDDLLVSTDDLASMYRGSPAGLEPSPSWKARLR